MIRNEVDDWVGILKGLYQNFGEEVDGVSEDSGIGADEDHLFLQGHQGQNIQENVQSEERKDIIGPLLSHTVGKCFSAKLEVGFVVATDGKVKKLIGYDRLAC